MNLHLPPQILELYHPTLKIHKQTALKLVLRPINLHVSKAVVSGLQRQVLQLAAHDVQHLRYACGVACRADAEEAAVSVGVVEADAGLHPAVLVQDVAVEARVHAFTRPAGAEGAPAAEEGL